MRPPVSGFARSPLVGIRPSDMRVIPVGRPIREFAPKPRGLLVCNVNGDWLSRLTEEQHAHLQALRDAGKDEAAVGAQFQAYAERAEGWLTVTQDDDVIVWHDLPQDKEDFRSILSIAAVVVSFWNPYVGYWLAAASVAYNLLVPPTLPRAPRRPEGGDLFTTGLNGNEARLDQPIWKICGRREITPPFACQPYSEFLPKGGEPNPTKDNEQYFYALYAVGVGNHTVTAKIANTPITRFADVLLAQYLAPGVQPSSVQANVTTAIEVSSQVLDSGRYVGGFAACAPNRTCSAIGIDIVATHGLGKGGNPLTVSWRVEFRPINDFGQVLGSWALLGSTQTRTGYTSTPQPWSVRFELATAARVEIRVVRVDIKDTAPDALHELAWTGLRAYLAEPAPLNQHAAHFELVMRSTDQLSNAASGDLRLIVEAYCRTLDANLAWQAEAHSRVPAYWILDLATSDTWGIDKPDTRVDLQSFYDLAQINITRQDRFDWVFDATMNAWDAMQLIARSCRSRVFRRNGVISVARDELANLPVTAFTLRNCNPNMTIQEKLRNRKSPDGIVIEYQDHRTWEWTPIECPCPGLGGTDMVNPVIIRLEGVTGATQAEREGLYEAESLVRRPRIAMWTTEMQGVLPAYMSPVDYLPDIKGYGHSGDVAFWDDVTLTMGLSEPADFTAGPLYLTLVRDDGSLTLDVPVTPGPTEYDIILPATPDFVVVVDDGHRDRTKYLLGTKDLVKVISIEDGGKTEDGAQLYNLSGVIDDDRVHQADIHLLPGPGSIQDPVGDPNDLGGQGGGGGGTFVIVNLHDLGIFAQGFDAVMTSSLTLGNDGVASMVGNLYAGTMTNHWIAFAPVQLTVADDYEVRATILSINYGPLNDPVNYPLNYSGTFDTWLPLSTARTWSAVADVTDGTHTNQGQIVIRLEIREISTGIQQAMATVTLFVQSENAP